MKLLQIMECSKVALFGDSQLRGSKMMRGVDVFPSPGSNFRDWVNFCVNREALKFLRLEERTDIIIFLGTNNIANILKTCRNKKIPLCTAENWKTVLPLDIEILIENNIIKYAWELIGVIRVISQAKIHICGIPPRLQDFKQAQNLIYWTNNKLRDMQYMVDKKQVEDHRYIYRNFDFWPTYKPFWENGHVRTKFFSIYHEYTGKLDLVHLNKSGRDLLRLYFCQRIGKAAHQKRGKSLLVNKFRFNKTRKCHHGKFRYT